MTTEFKLRHLCCVCCAEKVEQALLANPAITAARVDYAKDCVTVTHSTTIDPSAIAGIIKSAGHGCSIEDIRGPEAEVAQQADHDVLGKTASGGHDQHTGAEAAARLTADSLAHDRQRARLGAHG